MFKNYLKIAIRNLVKNKVYSFINILGMAIGLACFILISTFIKNELNYDNFHENAERIYRPVEVQHNPGVATQDVAVTMGPLAAALKNDFPEIESAARMMPVGEIFFKYGDKGYYEDKISFVDAEILDIFTIPLIKGDIQNALQNPYSLIISETTAQKYFGDENPIGKTLTGQYFFGTDEFKIAGVMKDYPENSHIAFQILGSFSLLENRLSWLKSWNTNSMATYVLLRENTDVQALESKFPEFIKKYRPDETPGMEMGLYLQSLHSIHLHSGDIVYQTYNNNQGDINTVYTFSIIALFILLIACFNFMNLSTARSAKRAKEVGMRKVLGSMRKNLIVQFLGESIIISAIAFLVSLLLVELAFPYLQSILGGRLIESHYEWKFFMQLIGLIILIGVISGSYPAFVLSSFQPVQSLKGAIFSFGKGTKLRKILVVVQFSMAIALISSTGIVMDQIDYIQNKDLGYNKEQIVYLPMREKALKNKIELLKNELLKSPNISNVSATAGLKGASGSQGTMTAVHNEEKTDMMMRWSFVDFEYLETMEMKVLQGRSFSKSYSSDTVTSIIINSAAVKEFGWENPLGKEFSAGDDKSNYKVIGVVNDFHFYSLKQKIEPLIMWINQERCNFIVAKINAHDISSTLAFMENIWNTHLPDRPFEASFLDEHFKIVYQNDQNLKNLFAMFSFFAIFVGCLGLFGLASFTVEQKTKEIGIRKVMGASIAGIVMLLSKEFAKWVAIASLIGFPIAYFSMQNWLSNFVYRTGIHFYTFIVAAFIVILIALFTISFQTIKAAVANPVKALKYE